MPPERFSLAEIFAGLDGVFRRLHLRWYLFGAQAALLHGAARLTADVDVTVEVLDLPVGELVDALRDAGFSSRIADPTQFAEASRVLPMVHDVSRIPVDVVLAGPGLEALFLGRVVTREIGTVRVPVAAAEDMVTMKILAGRPKDLEDAVAVLAAGADRLDLGLIRETLILLEEALAQSDLLPRLEELLIRAKRR